MSFPGSRSFYSYPRTIQRFIRPAILEPFSGFWAKFSWKLSIQLVSPIRQPTQKNNCCKGRSSLMALTDLHSQLCETSIKQFRLLSAFLYVEDDSSRVGGHHAWNTLHKYGLRCLLPSLVQNYITNFTFPVRVSNQLSSPFILKKMKSSGPPLLRDTLFIFTINCVTSTAPPPPHPSKSILFAYDFSIPLRTNNHQRVQRIITEIPNGLHTRVFVYLPRIPISWKKTNYLPLFLLNYELIPRVTSTKFLGFTFEIDHSLLSQIKNIKVKSLLSLNNFKYVPGALENRLYLPCHAQLPLDRLLVRSIIQYSSPRRSLTHPSLLTLLDPIQNSAIGICTGTVQCKPVLQ